MASRCPAPGWGVFLASVGLATALLAAVLAWASWSIDWLGLGSHWGWRVGLMAAVLGGVAMLYFGLLALLGMRPQQFMRHG